MSAMVQKPAFLITIDTEGDNLWARPRHVTTRNAAYLPRFQALCERYGLRPTYLTNWEMVQCPVFREFALDAQGRGAAEIGMHLHAWDSPPLVPLTDDDARYHPFLIEYPQPVMRDKIHTLTDRLEEVFGQPMISHRAGRWAFNATYARLLLERGYRVDCSVTPHVSWRSHLGDPAQAGGSDYTECADSAFFVDLSDIRRPGESELLEVPMTVIRQSWPASVQALRAMLGPFPLAGRLTRRLYPEIAWLRPDGRNLRSLLRVLELALERKFEYVEFMLHSSEFMPGGSPTFPSARSIERLYEHMDALFSQAAPRIEAMTLAQFDRRFREARAAGRSQANACPAIH